MGCGCDCGCGCLWVVVVCLMVCCPSFRSLILFSCSCRAVAPAPAPFCIDWHKVSLSLYHKQRERRPGFATNKSHGWQRCRRCSRCERAEQNKTVEMQQEVQEQKGKAKGKGEGEGRSTCVDSTVRLVVTGFMRTPLHIPSQLIHTTHMESVVRYTT